MHKILMSKIGSEVIEKIFTVLTSFAVAVIVSPFIRGVISSITNGEIRTPTQMFEQFGIYEGKYQNGNSSLSVSATGDFIFIKNTSNGYRLEVDADGKTCRRINLKTGEVLEGTFDKYTIEPQSNGSYKYKFTYYVNGSKKSDYFLFTEEEACALNENGCN